MTDYDKIAKDYSKNQEEDITRRYCFDPFFMNLLGNLKGKNVLDLACGSGYFTRKIKLSGAKNVVGVDLSEKMLKLAREQEKENPLGIEYRLGDATKLGKIDEFDIVTAGFILNYSKTKEEIFKMGQGVYNNLKEEGGFVTINLNPEHPLILNKKYGVTIKGDEKSDEGGKMNVTLFSEGKESCSFDVRHWSKKIYEEMLEKSGFKKITWHPVIVSEEGIKKFGKDFWEEYSNGSCNTIIEAVK